MPWATEEDVDTLLRRYDRRLASLRRRLEASQRLLRTSRDIALAVHNDALATRIAVELAQGDKVLARERAAQEKEATA